MNFSLDMSTHTVQHNIRSFAIKMVQDSFQLRRSVKFRIQSCQYYYGPSGPNNYYDLNGVTYKSIPGTYGTI